MKPEPITILVCSAGRRNYLVRWFRESLENAGFTGRVIAGDADPYAASSAASDSSVQLPLLSDASYASELLKQCKQLDATLLVSLNDHELSMWSEMNRADFARIGTTIIALGSEMQLAVEDKYVCGGILKSVGLRTPTTMLASEILNGHAAPFAIDTDVIVKHRFGSGSVGMMRCRASELESVLDRAIYSACDRTGRTITDQHEAADALIVQQVIRGHEFGIDVVNDFAGHHVGTLARRKIHMRGGETDQAVTVSPRQFAALGSSLGSAVGHRGLIDVDIIVDSNADAWIIDVNPRFGGGYPFSHIAGADVPSCYIAWLTGAPIREEWLRCRNGVVGSKYQDIATVTAARAVTHV